jgi:hypothetical protein
VKIFVSENNDRVEEESVLKGCRADVLVEVNGCFYKPFVNTLERLSQEANDAFARGDAYDVDPCQIIVKKASKDNIIKTILYLYEEGFFEAFIPIDLRKMYQYAFQHLSDIANWSQIF